MQSTYFSNFTTILLSLFESSCMLGSSVSLWVAVKRLAGGAFGAQANVLERAPLVFDRDNQSINQAFISGSKAHKHTHTHTHTHTPTTNYTFPLPFYRCRFTFYPVCVSVCVGGHTGELCKNGWTDRDAVWTQRSHVLNGECTLAPPDEYAWTIRARRRCGGDGSIDRPR